jgi:hypothetical protein
LVVVEFRFYDRGAVKQGCLILLNGGLVKLHRCWFKFANLRKTDPFNLGCGVTAYDYDDAMNILRECVFHGTSLPPLESVIEDVDVSTLDAGHVLPNMDVPIFRDVWFPKGIKNPPV